jgi:hypothetical protein
LHAGPAHVDDWPLSILLVGRKLQAMNPADADAEALRYALALARDQAGPIDASGRNRRFTGQKAYAAWAALLRNMDEPVEDRHHANVRQILILNRRAAVAFLTEIADRQGDPAAQTLRSAAAAYEGVIESVTQLDVGGLATSPESRRQFAARLDRIAQQELESAALIERALAHMPRPTTLP